MAGTLGCIVHWGCTHDELYIEHGGVHKIGQKSGTINPMHNKLAHQTKVGIDDMAEWHICKHVLYDGESFGQDDIQPRSLGMYTMYIYGSYAYANTS